ncbi:MAG: DUF296 domain-containing protein [Roseibium sp.]
MRRPAPLTPADIVHPGPAAPERIPFRTCRADKVAPTVGDGAPLLEALGHFADVDGFGAAVLDLGGLALGPFDYVMPDRAVDDRHVAWYSDTHTSSGAVLKEGVAILGWRDGKRFAHIHAYWLEDGEDRLGHLLPETLVTAAPARLTGYGLNGATFDAAPDPETEFTLFRVRPDGRHLAQEPHNALIATLAPFADLHNSIDALAGRFGASDLEVMGLGSLAGAGFLDAPPMTGLISEILLQPGAGRSGGTGLRLPARCVDHNGRLSRGVIRPGRAPTLVTCELLITTSGRTG